MSVGVPSKLIHEAKNNIITVEVKTGDTYRGFLVDLDDTMNCLIENCVQTTVDGKSIRIDQIFLRGSQIRFFIVPDMFKNAPMFSRVKNQARVKNDSNLRKRANQIRDQIIAQMKPE